MFRLGDKTSSKISRFGKGLFWRSLKLHNQGARTSRTFRRKFIPHLQNILTRNNPRKWDLDYFYEKHNTNQEKKALGTRIIHRKFYRGCASKLTRRISDNENFLRNLGKNPKFTWSFRNLAPPGLNFEIISFVRDFFYLWFISLTLWLSKRAPGASKLKSSNSTIRI